MLDWFRVICPFSTVAHNCSPDVNNRLGKLGPLESKRNTLHVINQHHGTTSNPIIATSFREYSNTKMSDQSRQKATVFVGGLDHRVDTQTLHDAFIPFGEIVDVSLPKPELYVELKTNTFHYSQSKPNH